MTDSQLPDMHDWTLQRVAYDWVAAEVTVSFLTSSGPRMLVASKSTELRVPQYRDWGSSVSVNGAQWDDRAEAAALRIEMQSGDVITIEAEAFAVR